MIISESAVMLLSVHKWENVFDTNISFRTIWPSLKQHSLMMIRVIHLGLWLIYEGKSRLLML